MGLVKSDIPTALTAGVKALFIKELEKINNNYLSVAMVVPSNKSAETYNWLGDIPQMREFIDERALYGLSENPFTITNKTWEVTLEVKRDALEDEQYGQIRQRVLQIAESAARHKNALVMQLVKNSFTATCYDGQALCADAHPNGGYTLDNKGTTALTSASLAATRAAMMKFRGDTGHYLGIIPDTLVVGPDLEALALELTESDINVTKPGDGTAGSGATAATGYKNIHRGKYRVVCDPELTDSNDWWLIDSSKALKPFILQERVAPQLDILGEGDHADSTFMRDAIYYGVRARYNAGCGMPHLIYGHAVSGS